MTISVLFQKPKDRMANESPTEPKFFVDLNLDQIVTTVTAGKEEYNLTPFFYMPLHDSDSVMYRHEVMQDLEDPKLFKAIDCFAKCMHEVRETLAQTEKDFYEHQNERWFLDAANNYVAAILKLADDLSSRHFQSRGLIAFKQYLDDYIKSERFTMLTQQTQELETELDSLRYEVLIEGLRVEVRRYKNEPNYSSEIQETFKRFSQEAETEYSYNFKEHSAMNQVEGRILDLVAELYADTFSKLTAYCTEHIKFMDATVIKFDREIQFYVAYLEYIAKLRNKNLHFCYPVVSQTSKAISAKDIFDLALATKLQKIGQIPVTNDFYLKGPERIIVVSGPNQGGKTTFARTFGQLHYLASLGLITPGTKAQLYLPDNIFTHFEKEEKMTNLRGKLEDDLLRVHDILQAATPNSIILINEIFTSTTLHDAILLSKRVATSIMKLDALCVWITFIDEVASLSEKTISMVSSVVPDKPAVRTFKITRQPADGLAYALSIAEKHHLTSSQIMKRIKP